MKTFFFSHNLCYKKAIHIYMAFLGNAYCCDDVHGPDTMSNHQWVSPEMVSSLARHVVNQLHNVLHETLCVHHH